jgi:hypothetical protein
VKEAKFGYIPSSFIQHRSSYLELLQQLAGEVWMFINFIEITRERVLFVILVICDFVYFILSTNCWVSKPLEVEGHLYYPTAS